MNRDNSERAAGILLHPTALPSVYGVGDLGPSAYRFVDFLHASGQRLWQVLPLVPPDSEGSPYASSSAFAGSPLLISPELLMEKGLLPHDTGWSKSDDRVHYREVALRKQRLLEIAYFSCMQSRRNRAALQGYRSKEAWWLDDYSLFAALKDHFGSRVPWTRWPKSIRERRPAAMKVWGTRLRSRVRFHEFVQWQFEQQWRGLQRYAHRRGVSIIGDVPIFVTRDSADTWAHPGQFLLDRLGRPTVVAGVPPDYYNRRGQIWGDPLYRWDRMRKGGYAWWRKRFRRSFALYDQVRLDHFRGYCAVWGIRPKSRTSRFGSWHAGPGLDLFRTVLRAGDRKRLIAEDLGTITQDVTDLRNAVGIPGLRVLQFGFGSPDSMYHPRNVSRRSVSCTGTHDNNTTRGWFQHDATVWERRNVRTYLGAATNARTVAWRLMGAAYRSRAERVIIPLQDILNLGQEGRFNTPGTPHNNWRWRFRSSQLTPTLAKRLRWLVRTNQR